jgi:hypothetical protein
MKVFLSWSGSPSKMVALALRKWLRKILQHLEPWISVRDIQAGRPWQDELAAELKDSNFGIICLTKENIGAPWILFEAGALAKTVSKAHVCPYLLDLNPSMLSGSPLAGFQAKSADRQSTLDIVEALNCASNSKVDSQILTETFNAFWPEFEKILNEARSLKSVSEKS